MDPVTLAVEYRGTAGMSKDLQFFREPTKLFHRPDYFDTVEEELKLVKRHIPH